MRTPIFKKPLVMVMSIIAIAILALEFFYDLKKEMVLSRIVTGLDVSLLTIFFIAILVMAYRNRERLLSFINDHKADVAYLVLILSFLFLPRLAGGLLIARLLVALLMRTLESPIGTKLVSTIKLRPSQALALSFVGLITTGTVLLTFPAATADGRGAPLLNALFTMTSASCVSGLSIYNIGADFTRFGQAVILFGIQAGGLGIMVLSAAFAVLVGGTIPSRRQMGLREVLDISTPEGLKSLIKAVTAATLVTELLGALVLFWLSRAHIPVVNERLWWSIFHSVSAFCNAGISLSATSLTDFVNDSTLCLVFMVLITIGGIGFFVISDLMDSEVWVVKKPQAIWARLQIQTKVVLIATIILNSLGMLLFLFFEYDGALHGLPAGKKIVASLFHAISLRSAGFSLVPIDGLSAPAVLFSIGFMFIGASPGSTGGGIKTTTAAISVMALRAMLRGREEVEILGRRMPASVVSRSLSIVLIASMVVAVFLTLLLATQDIRFDKLFFEAVSAFGTVGLSMDTTTSLNNTGRLIIICLMYVGRIGPLTMALAIGEKKFAQGYQLPRGRIAVG